MSQTEEIRAKLDELGVEHEDTDISVGEKAYGATTCWECGGVGARFSEKADVGTLLEAWDVTAKQAISATVGAGTCELINAANDLGEGTSSCMCFKCGYTALDDWWDEFNYCPNCGRRIQALEKRE